MRLVIVGNASEPWLGFPDEPASLAQIGDFIDTSDLVVRFNKARNQDEPWAGHRTDILYVRGNGKPASWFSRDPLKFTHAERPKLVLSVVDMWSYSRGRPDKHEQIDYTDQIKATNGFENIRRIDEGVLVEARRLLNSVNSTLRPSLGLVAFVDLLQKPEFSNYEKFLVGFTYSGWEGHDWPNEERFVEEWYRCQAFKPITPLQPVTASTVPAEPRAKFQFRQLWKLGW